MAGGGGGTGEKGTIDLGTPVYIITPLVLTEL